MTEGKFFLGLVAVLLGFFVMLLGLIWIERREEGLTRRACIAAGNEVVEGSCIRRAK